MRRHKVKCVLLDSAVQSVGPNLEAFFLDMTLLAG